MAHAKCRLLISVDDAPALGRVLLADHEPRVPLAKQRSQLLLSGGGDRAWGGQQAVESATYRLLAGAPAAVADSPLAQALT